MLSEVAALPHVGTLTSPYAPGAGAQISADGKVAYATKAEHDFRRPTDFDPRAYANRADWQLGEERGVAEIVISERIAWQVERHFGRYGEIREGDDAGRIFLTGYSNPRGLVSWVLGLGAHARLQGPAELTEEFERRLELLQLVLPPGL